MLDIPLAEKRPPQIHMQTRYISCFKYFTLSSVSLPYRLSGKSSTCQCQVPFFYYEQVQQLFEQAMC